MPACRRLLTSSLTLGLFLVGPPTGCQRLRPQPAEMDWPRDDQRLRKARPEHQPFERAVPDRVRPKQAPPILIVAH